MTRFVAHCRSGRGQVRGVSKPRADLYHRLIYRNIDETLRQIYPVAFHALQGERWDCLVSEFMAGHRIQTPYLWQMPREFLYFAAVQRYEERFSMPYLQELLLFEWIEVELYMMADIPFPPFESGGDLLECGLVLNPEHRLLAFRFPVFRCPPRQLKALEGRYCLVAFRAAHTKEVEFIELSALFSIGIEMLACSIMTGRALLDALAELTPQVERQALERVGKALLQLALERGLLLGCEED